MKSHLFTDTSINAYYYLLLWPVFGINGMRQRKSVEMRLDQLVDIIMPVTQWLYHGSAYLTAAAAASPAKSPDRDWPQPGQ